MKALIRRLTLGKGLISNRGKRLFFLNKIIWIFLVFSRDLISLLANFLKTCINSSFPSSCVWVSFVNILNLCDLKLGLKSKYHFFFPLHFQSVWSIVIRNTYNEVQILLFHVKLWKLDASDVTSQCLILLICKIGIPTTATTIVTANICWVFIIYSAQF